MGLKFWLDDIRPSPSGEWVWRKDAQEAIQFLETAKHHGSVIDVAQLDHDLGGLVSGNVCQKCTLVEMGSLANAMELWAHGCEHVQTGRAVVEWMLVNNYWPSKIVIHSWNPDGAKRMASIAEGHCEVEVKPFGLK